MRRAPCRAPDSVWVRRRLQAAGVTLIIGAWGRVGRLGLSRAISISVRAPLAHSVRECAFVCRNPTERQMSEMTFDKQA
ncbi:protein of unknown function [Paraburkholderia dioscoreae]|uniref:Uncharacterized protein n=1 Tax=Paraburkholderia dioscoreae TaxID=2604047 RepID=A0A5Q4Z1I1_9BURK|nr:protein of unknown function [Paraburkholderia dioscoreae]